MSKYSQPRHRIPLLFRCTPRNIRGNSNTHFHKLLVPRVRLFVWHSIPVYAYMYIFTRIIYRLSLRNFFFPLSTSRARITSTFLDMYTSPTPESFIEPAIDVSRFQPMTCVGYALRVYFLHIFETFSLHVRL